MARSTKINTSVSLDASDYAEVSRLALLDQSSLGSICRRGIRFYLAHIKAAEEREAVHGAR